MMTPSRLPSLLIILALYFIYADATDAVASIRRVDVSTTAAATPSPGCANSVSTVIADVTSHRCLCHTANASIVADCSMAMHDNASMYYNLTSLFKSLPRDVNTLSIVINNTY